MILELIKYGVQDIAMTGGGATEQDPGVREAQRLRQLAYDDLFEFEPVSAFEKVTFGFFFAVQIYLLCHGIPTPPMGGPYQVRRRKNLLLL